MSEYKLSALEQETYINYSNDSKEATIYSCCPRRIKELEGLCKEYPNEYYIIKKDNVSIEVGTNKNNVRLKKPRTISDKHREFISNNLRRYREEQKALEN